MRQRRWQVRFLPRRGRGVLRVNEMNQTRTQRFGPRTVLLLATLLSISGDLAHGVAFAVWVYERTNSAIWVGASIIGRTGLRVLLGARGGTFADRHHTGDVLLYANLVQVAIYCVIATIVAYDGSVLVCVILLTTCVVFETPYQPALIRVIPRLTDDAGLDRLNALYETAAQVAIFAGPGIGGLLLYVGPPEAAILFNAATFAVAALLVSRLPNVAPMAIEDDADLKPSVLSVARRAPGLKVMIGGSFAMTLMYGAEGALVIPGLVEILDQESRTASWVYLAMGVGALISGLTVAAVGKAPAVRWLWPVIAACAPTLFVIGVGAPLAIVVVVFALSGAAGSIIEVAFHSFVQRDVPAEYAGRTYGFLGAVAAAGSLIGAGVGAALAEWVSTRIALITVSAIALAAVAITTTWSRLGATPAANTHPDAL
jgi:predicted MFS family arabinose efflux permease